MCVFFVCVCAASPLEVAAESVHPAVLVLLHDRSVKVAHFEGLAEEAGGDPATVHGMVDPLPRHWVDHTWREGRV